jgi:hypothetical protein
VRIRSLLVALALAGLASCSSSSSETAKPVDPGTAAPDSSSCGEGFTSLGANAGCTPILPAAACAPGTRAGIGSTECVPVGVTTCAAGFVKDASGWGCEPVLAPTACPISSATRERLGVTGCVPISDCNAPFPPPGTTSTVNAAYTDAQLDATHFRSIADAVNAAAAGAVIAVDAGTYVEKVVMRRRAASIIGRCTEKVVMKQAAGVIGSAFEIGNGDDVLVKNMSLRGYNAAIGALGGSTRLDSLAIEDGLLAGVAAGNFGTEVSLVNVVVRGMRPRSGAVEGYGVFASAGATVVIDDSVFSANESINVAATKADTTVTLRRSIVRDGKPLASKGTLGLGLNGAEGASITVEESAIIDNTTAGFGLVSAAGSAQSTGILRRSVIRGTKRDAVKKTGRGLDVTSGHAVVEESTIGSSSDIEVNALGGAIELTSTTLLGAPTLAGTERGATGILTNNATTKAKSVAIIAPKAGVEVQSKGRLDMASSLVLGTRTGPKSYENGRYVGLGVVVESTASLVLASSTLQETHTTGLTVAGQADVTSTLIRGTRASLNGLAGRGMSVVSGGTATLTGSALIDNTESGILVTAGGSSLTMGGTTIQDTGFDPAGSFGFGLVFYGDAIGTIENSTITGSKGVGFAVGAAGAFVRSSTLSRNAVAVHAQDGTTLSEGEAAGDGRSFVISNDTRFIDNQTRVGSGFVPLPTVLDPKSP